MKLFPLLDYYDVLYRVSDSAMFGMDLSLTQIFNCERQVESFTLSLAMCTMVSCQYCCCITDYIVKLLFKFSIVLMASD